MAPPPRRSTVHSDDFEGRYTPPTHYSLKIQSFSLLSKSSVDKYTSDKFEAGDHKWKLTIYPNGNKERGAKGHISIYVGLVDTSSLPAGWEVKAIINMFVHDQIQDTYVTLSDDRKVKRLHAMKTEWGIADFIDLDEFSDPSNGFLINDTCVFGVDIFVLKQTSKGECLSLLDEPATGKHTWKIKSFSNLTLDRYESEAFTVGDHKWKIWIYPRGNGDGKGNSVSAFLSLDESTLPPDTRVFVKFILRVIAQNQTKDSRVEPEIENHFGPSTLVFGSPKFISLAKLNDPTKGFLLDDTCTIEAQVSVLGTVATAS
ncbi:hypothetical protein RHGRI_035615 [Rhododendron griersonianum]|uniref:MATH domain-containing protein n=1 Tax=Rhododendron griersonianum TaxID=479676 RepID=A0AAV6HQD9_9ERIC|nr:hypothetical protein RHGRI_035615 [Rhododendron griersonianum]